MNGTCGQSNPDELQRGDWPLWYLPHHPVTHLLKPEKVRVVFDCAGQFEHTSLNQQLLQGPGFDVFPTRDCGHCSRNTINVPPI